MTLHYQVSVILVILSMFHNGGLNTIGSKHYLAVVNFKDFKHFLAIETENHWLGGWVVGAWGSWCLGGRVLVRLGGHIAIPQGRWRRESHPKVRGAHHLQHGAGKTPRRTGSA